MDKLKMHSLDGVERNIELIGKLFPNAIEVTPDKQGRIQLTPRLLAHAGLEKDVTVVGMGRYAEIWNTAVWDERESAGEDGALEQAIRLMNIR